jgi:hypothetical protein
MLERYGYTIFCDDIRNEPGGKLTFVGCYNAIMFVSQRFPLSLPKFCTHLHIFSPATQPYKSVVARCYLPGESDPISEETIEVPSLRDQENLLKGLPKETLPPFIVVAASLIFAPLEIAQPGLIHIRALINDGPNELHLGSLQIVAKT